MRARLIAALAASMVVTTACVIETVAVPRRTPLVQVHAILNTQLGEQLVIVERILGDEGGTNERGGAVPISGALVELIIPGGRSLIGREVVDTADRASQLEPAQVIESTRRYEIPTDFPNLIAPGARYDLRVTTPQGEVVTGSTVVPFQVNRTAISRTLNRVVDTLNLEWTAPQGAAAFWVRVEGPFSSFDQFVKEPRVRLGGGLQSLDFGKQRRDVFYPGFVSPVTVAAIDQNAYDYFRSANDPFTGSGRINRLVGGFGVFGSMTLVQSVSAEVTAPTVDPVLEGRWQLISTGAAIARATELRIFVDHNVAPVDSSTVTYTGSYSAESRPRRPITILRADSDIALYLLAAGGAVVEETLQGFVRRDTMFMIYERDAVAATFVRRR
jgi:hypothetical protein